MRDDFRQPTKELLAKRVGFKCSYPPCRRPTIGPQEAPDGSVNVGVACHIAAASVGGARYDGTMTPEERASTDNGIWLCQTHAKLVDNDETAYTVEIVRAWKMLAEATAKVEIERGITIPVDDRFARAERDMPELLKEMREDLASYPFKRRFVVILQRCLFSTRELDYSAEKHPHLGDQVRILENLGLVRQVAYGNGSLPCYQMSEEFADYLRVR